VQIRETFIHLFIKIISMSSYNENLHSNVIASLQTQELELKKIEAKKNATMFSLYYAEGATLKASEELENTAVVWKNKTDVKTQAVASSNISNNLLDSANQASVYVKQSVTNSAVSAANVQLAANSIVRLASDLGSIYGIVYAADAKSDIYTLAEESRRLINDTAYDAELASQTAMDASILTSEVTTSAVQDKAKSNNDLMNSVLKIVADEFTANTQLIMADDATLASVSAVEKLSEGDYLDITVDLKSTKSAYNATNKGLNLNLQVTTSGKSSSIFTVGFDPIKMPFKHLHDAAVAVAKTPNPFYPVKDYYFIVVKDAKKSTFSISNAEGILINYTATTPTTPTTPATASPAPATTAAKQPLPVAQGRQIIPLQVPVGSGADANATDSPAKKVKKPTHISQIINFQEMIIDDQGPYTIQDSDGDDIKLGIKYVVFVLAIYTDDYKKKLNCFDEYLSAPSLPFTLTNKLVAVKGKTIKVTDPLAVTTPPATPPAAAAATPPVTVPAPPPATPPATPVNYDYLLNFQVAENPENISRVEYRCIFLPPNDPWSGTLLNTESTDVLNNEVESLESIAEEYDPQIAISEASVIDLQNSVDILTSQQQALNPGNNTTNDAAAAAADAKQLLAVNAQLKDQNTKLETSKKSLVDLTNERNKKIEDIKPVGDEGKVGFLFNLKIAEQVLAGNYIPAINPVPAPVEPTTTTPVSKKTKSGTTDKDAEPAYAVLQWDVQVKADVTDNFGNPLIPGQIYTPVIISYCVADEDNLDMFTNNWSGYTQSKGFHYKPLPSTKHAPVKTQIL
jgi:hypothetical protein